MAKHSKKKIHFTFIDLSEAEAFLELVQRKKMYANVTANFFPSGKLELTLVGSPENIKFSIQKLKKLRKSLIQSPSKINTFSEDESEDIDLKLQLKKLKFEES
ncbi:MAG: hypothetical protein JW776_11210 [Candidatus Lokiarchaeota archaeon]|nr:hypothetical protein [Candidatus Lokiarchaeota archaeon]